MTRLSLIILPPDLLQKIQLYLSESKLPFISPSHTANLNVHITDDEVIATWWPALLLLQNFPSHPPPAYHLPLYYNSFLADSPIARDMQSIFITMIPKPGKKNTLCSNYKPIALLNLDLKRFTKILANRLNKLFPFVIHKDQVGFIPFRQVTILGK